MRGAVAALFATTVALCSHVLAGGSVPDLLGIMLPLAVSAQVCILLSGQRFSLLRLSIAVAFSQFFFHGLFSMGAGHGGGASMTVNTQHGHLMHATLAASSESPVSGQLPHGGPMLAAHVIAAIATVLVFHRSESILFSLAGLLELFSFGFLWLLLAAFRVPTLPPRRPVRRTEPTAFASAVFVSCVARRGPPASSMV
ncbi:hypothetical protein ACSYDW_15815 [Paeniglutamicibacter sp. R2-26]|uniref:hypothetical protein n=1 Tax=Paeniglutamicibacter sp. R2-26 TaxID=3144417 RepID=UPI003EE69D8C